jgi:hypothetical protein
MCGDVCARVAMRTLNPCPVPQKVREAAAGHRARAGTAARAVGGVFECADCVVSTANDAVLCVCVCVCVLCGVCD